MIEFLLTGISLGLSAAISPGPFQTFVIGQTLRMGWRRTLPAMFAPLLSDVPIVAAMLLVLNAVPSGMIRFIQIAGGVFVLTLSWRTLLAWRADDIPADTTAENNQRTLLKAVGMNFLSPGPYLFWSLLAGPVLLRGWRITPAHGLLFVAGFYVTLCGGIALTILIFGLARRLGPRINHFLIGLSALAMAAFGVYQLWQGIFNSAL